MLGSSSACVPLSLTPSAVPAGRVDGLTVDVTRGSGRHCLLIEQAKGRDDVCAAGDGGKKRLYIKIALVFLIVFAVIGVVCTRAYINNKCSGPEV